MNFVIQVTACVGILEACASILQLGFLIRFLGQPVVNGFMAGSAIVISMSQLKDILGVSVPNEATVQDMIKNIDSVRSTINGYAILFFFIWLTYIFTHRFVCKLAKGRTSSPRFKILLMVLEPLGPLISIIIGAAIIQGAPTLRGAPYKLSYIGSIPQGSRECSLYSFQGMQLHSGPPSPHFGDGSEFPRWWILAHSAQGESKSTQNGVSKGTHPGAVPR